LGRIFESCFFEGFSRDLQEFLKDYRGLFFEGFSRDHQRIFGKIRAGLQADLERIFERYPLRDLVSISEKYS